MAVTTEDDAIKTLLSAINARLASREKRARNWNNKIKAARDAITALNRLHNKQVDVQYQLLEDIKNRLNPRTSEDVFMTPQVECSFTHFTINEASTDRSKTASRTARLPPRPTVERVSGESDDLVGYESGFQMDTGSEMPPRAVPERSPGTAMPTEAVPSIEIQETAITSRQQGSSSMARPRNVAPEANMLPTPSTASGKKRKRQEPVPSSTGKLKKPKLPVKPMTIPGPSSMAPPALPLNKANRKGRQAGLQRTKNLLDFYDRGLREMSRVQAEESVPPATFCNCDRRDCKICVAQKEG